MSMARLSAATASRAAAPLGAAANMALSFRCWNLSFFSRICSGAQITHSVGHCLPYDFQARKLQRRQLRLSIQGNRVQMMHRHKTWSLQGQPSMMI